MYQLSDLENGILFFLSICWYGFLIFACIYAIRQYFQLIKRVKDIEDYLHTNVPYIEKMLEDLKSCDGSR